MSKRKFSSTAVAMLGAAAISGLLAGTASASSDMSSSRLLLKGSAVANAFGAAADAANVADKHMCKGHNSCAGHGGCKTGDNGCKGKNSCKGKGGCNTMEAAPASPAASPAAAPHAAH